MKKILVLLLCLSLTVSLFSACSKTDKADESMTKEETKEESKEDSKDEPKKEEEAADFDTDDNHFTLYMPASTVPLELDGDITQVIMEKQGIIWDSIEIGTGTDIGEQINLKLAGGQLPDVISFPASNESWGRLVNEGKVIELDGYFNDGGRFPNLAKIDKRVLNYHLFNDGHNYYLPGGYEPVLEQPSGWQGQANGFRIRLDLLKKVGMTLDDVATLEGYEAFLRAIKGSTDSDGREFIPMALAGQDFNGQEMIMAMFGVLEWNEQADGSVVPDYKTPGFIEAWKWLNQMYTEGLLDQETPYHKDDLYNEKMASLRYASMISYWVAPIDTIVADTGFDTSKPWSDFVEFGIPEIWVEVAPLPKVSGYELAPFATYNPFGGGATAITTNSSNPDLLMKAFDWMQTQEAYYLMEWGPEEFGAYETIDGVPAQINEIFIGPEFWGGGTQKAGERGFWWWKSLGGPALTHFPFLEPPWIAANTQLVKAEDINRDQGAFTYVHNYQRIKPTIGGSIVKYKPIQTDIRMKYYAKMCMAETAGDFESAYMDFLAEMKTSGHDEETITEFNELYSDYKSTPAGQIDITVDKYIPRNVWGDGPVITGGE